MPNGYDGPERRSETSEWARWRGGLEARVESLEKNVDTLVKEIALIDRTVTRMEGRVEMLQRDLSFARAEIATAAHEIDKGKQDAVATLQESIRAKDQHEASWKVTRQQVILGSLLAFLIAIASSLILAAITGQLA